MEMEIIMLMKTITWIYMFMWQFVVLFITVYIVLSMDKWVFFWPKWQYVELNMKSKFAMWSLEYGIISFL